MTRRTVLQGVCLLAAVMGVLGVSWPDRSAGAQVRGPESTPARKTVWSGVYTPEQAARGKKDYDMYCTLCHGPELGGADGPGLVGPGFLRNWLEDDLRSLVDKVQTRMPADSPGSLSPSEATDLVTFLLEQNGFPTGTQELSPEAAAQSTIRIEGKEGPGPVPNFSLVAVVGCLTPGPDAQWTLTSGTEPVRTRESGKTVRAADAPPQPLGTQAFRLVDVSTATVQALQGQKVEVIGLLMRQPAGAALNVTAVHPVAASCP